MDRIEQNQKITLEMVKQYIETIDNNKWNELRMLQGLVSKQRVLCKKQEFIKLGLQENDIIIATPFNVGFNCNEKEIYIFKKYLPHRMLLMRMNKKQIHEQRQYHYDDFESIVKTDHISFETQ